MGAALWEPVIFSHVLTSRPPQALLMRSTRGNLADDYSLLVPKARNPGHTLQYFENAAGTALL